MVTHIDSPTCFWAQVVDGQIELLQITENLVAVCPSATALMGQPVVEKVRLVLLPVCADYCTFPCIICIFCH